jgi:fatty acid desaturase
MKSNSFSERKFSRKKTHRPLTQAAEKDALEIVKLFLALFVLHFALVLLILILLVLLVLAVILLVLGLVLLVFGIHRKSSFRLVTLV